MDLSKFHLTPYVDIEARSTASNIISNLYRAPYFLSLRSIAEAIGVSYSTICKVYEMIQTPRYDVVYKLQKLSNFVYKEYNYGKDKEVL